MKSIKQQYIDLMEGKMSQHNFMRSLRMTMPQYVTNVTSFKDSVRILKNKGILSEAMDVKDEDEEFIDMIAKAEEEEAGKYTKFDDFEGGLSEAENTSLRNPNMAAKIVAQKHNAKLQTLQSDFKQFEREAIQLAGEEMLASGMNKVAIRNLLSGYGYFEDWISDYIDALTAELNNPEDEAPEDYEDPNMFDAYGMDASEGKINEGRKKKEPKAEMHPNQIHPQELRMGIKVELEHTDDLDKAKKIALDHLAENPFYYTALKLSGIESPSAPKAKYPVEKKAKKKKEAVEMVDAANQMQKVKMPKAVNEVRINAMPGEETNATMKHAMQYIDSEIANPTLKALSDKITLQSLRDNKALLRYEYWEPLPQDAINALEKQFDVEADTDIDDETLPREYYIISSKKTEKPEKYRAFQSKLEALVREVVAEYYDGRDNLDEDGGFEQWKQALYKIVMEKAKLEADEIAIDDAEIKQYYQKGKTPEEVYFDIWQQDAGNFFSISF